MPYAIPEGLLHKLRARREEQRRLREAQSLSTSKPQKRDVNFIESLRNLFSGASTPKDAASAYVQSMNSWQDEIEDTFDAFLLDPGMGPMTYLTADGRILEDSRGWDGDSIIEVHGLQANSALVVGARKTGIIELLDLIPPPPPGSRPCPKCNGERVAEPVAGFGHKFPCEQCEARGWLDAA